MEGLDSMIRIDVSKAIPRRLGTYLLGIIPGLLFISSIAIADPLQARNAMGLLREIYVFPPYGLLILALGGCFIVGQTFFLLSWQIDLLMSVLYRSGLFLVKATIGSDWFYRLIAKIQGFPPKSTAFTRFVWRAHMWGKEKRFVFNIRPVLRCQELAAEQILKQRYGITPTKGNSDFASQQWQVWVAVLGKPLPGFREAYLTMRTLLGCAIAGFVAIYLEPCLRNRYCLSISIIFAVAGLLGAWDFARLRYQPKRSSVIRLSSLLRELASAHQPLVKRKIEREEIGFEGDDAGIDKTA